MAAQVPHVLLVNPVSGRGDGRRIGEEIEKALRALGAEYELFSDPPGDQLVFRHPNASRRQVLVVGGDGTLRGVAEGLKGQPVELVMVPAGRGNDFARTLGLPIGLSAGELWKAALTATAPDADTVRCDLWHCNGRVFVNGAGFGFEGRVVEKMSRGGRSYAWEAAKRALRWKPFTADIHHETGRLTAEITNLSLMNGTFAGGGFRIAPHARLDDGMLDFVAAGGMHLWEKALYLPLVRRGAHLDLKGITFRQVRQVKLTTDRDVPWHLDGELMPPAREFVIERLDETLVFRRPRATPAAPPR